MTGDPHREVSLGLKWTTPDLERRQFSFSSFTLPACKACNTECAELEAKTKQIVEGILARDAISASNWNIFLDWLDKVRTGLWLGMIYLNKNHYGIQPHFHIKNRIGAKDRFLIIYEIIDDGDTGVGWSATESPLFEYKPSCFTLTINNFIFLNASCDFLFSKRFGFPFPSEREHRLGGGEWIEMTEGTREMQFPLIGRKFKTGGTQLFQPMIPYDFLRTKDGEVADCAEFYDNDYVRANCMDFAAGRGMIFRRQRKTLVAYSSLSSKEWIPKQRFPRGELHHQTGVLAGNFLKEIYENHPSFDNLPEDQRTEREMERVGALRLHKTMMDHYLAQKKIYY